MALMGIIAGMAFARVREWVTPDLRTFAVAVLMLCAINALVCGGLSAIIARYQERVSWVLGLVVILAFANVLSDGRKAGVSNSTANS